MKKNRLKNAPVIVQLYPQQIHEADLMRELKIDKFRLEKELMRQPTRYAFWASLYSVVAAKVELLKEKLENLESKLYLLYARRGVKRTTDLKHHVYSNMKHQILRAKLRKWSDSERVLKYSAMRGFEHRLNVLQTISANQRREWDSEVKGRKKSDKDSE